MQAIIFDVDHTLFAPDKALHDGVDELLHILRQLGVRLGAVSDNDHRTLVRLDEAGIRHHFVEVLCTDQVAKPKAPKAMRALLQKMEVDPRRSAFVSHVHTDIVLGKHAGLAKTIGVSHGQLNAMPLHKAGADHVVNDIPSVLDVLG